MATGINLLSLASAMDNADYVLVDGVVFATEYMRIPDDATTADDVVIEAKHGDDAARSTTPSISARASTGSKPAKSCVSCRAPRSTSAALHDRLSA